MSVEKYLDVQSVLDTIVEAVHAEKLAAIEATLAATGEKVNVLVAYRDEAREGREGTALFPLAIMFNKSPFEVLNPPDGSYTVRREEDGSESVVQ